METIKAILASQEFLNLVLLVMAAVVGLLGKAFLPLANDGRVVLKAKLGNEKLNLLKGMAVMIVKDIEQSLVNAGYDGAAKKEFALVRLLQLAKDYGFVIDSGFASKLIEEAVKDMNQVFGPILEDLAKPEVNQT